MLPAGQRLTVKTLDGWPSGPAPGESSGDGHCRLDSCRTPNADGVTVYLWLRSGRRPRSGLKKRLIVLAARNYAISYLSQITAKYGTDGLRPISLSPCLTNPSTHHCE